MSIHDDFEELDKEAVTGMREGTLDELLPGPSDPGEILNGQLYKVSIYRDDSVTTVVYTNVKHTFMTAGNSILTIAQYDSNGSHHYINWPREQFAWFKVERQEVQK